MPFAFLAPAFLAGLAALVVPVLIHLIQRERKEVVAFPSLMFLRRIPYQSVERRRIHNWLLLALRAAAIACLVAAFSRPFLKQSVAAAAARSGAREVVVLLDVSASMGYGDHWAHAVDAAHKVVATLGAEDRCTLVLFSRNAEENVRATSDRGRLDAAIAAAKVGSDGTRFAPALRLAQSLLSRSSLPRKEAVLISDFQKTGWERHEDIHLPEGATITPVSVATEGLSDLSVSSVAFARDTFSGEERVKVTAGLTNRGSTPYTNVAASLDVDGRRIDSRPVTIAPNAAESVTFLPFTVSETSMRGTVRVGTDALPSDNAYYFSLSPSRPLSVLIIQADGTDPASSVYLTTALGVGSAPPFKTDVVPVSRVTPSTVEHRTVVLLHDVTPLPSATDDLLKRFVEQGGGLLVALGDHTPWAGGQSPLLPGVIGPPIDRTSGVGGMLGFLDYSHQVLELFKDPRGGNFADAHFLRYRTLAPGPTDRVLARFDDGGVAMAERHVGSGRVIAWTSPFDDSWSVDFPKAKLFLPLVHQLVTYLAQYTEPTTSYIVGHLLDVSVPMAAIVRQGTAGDTQSAAARKATGLVVSPSGEQTTIGEGAAPSVALAEQGFYTVRMQGTGTERPFVAAVNLDPAESDLAPLEPTSFVAGVTGQAAVTASGQSLEHPDLTPADVERKQYAWWFLLVAGALALLGEAVLANRVSGRFGIGLMQVRRG
jgi:hypothetical protein